MFLKILHRVLVLLNHSCKFFGVPLKFTLGAQIPLVPPHGTVLLLGNICSVVSCSARRLTWVFLVVVIAAGRQILLVIVLVIIQVKK